MMRRHAPSLAVLAAVFMLVASAGAVGRAAASEHAAMAVTHHAADVAFEAMRILRVP